ncbi:DUF6875 domain-containing protein [Pseudogracilibacillus sp. SO30301A]|uniref:DUF6875 domain-containing protein n=1 Tax=Pseudogracilibacillus sp. SO30301A TaxID=3098291 RepID=UPI00300DBED9
MKELRELNNLEFDQYVKEISKGFCPYIAPSTKKDAIYFYNYELESNSIESINKDIFYISLMHTELFRNDRLSTNKSRALLLCRNIIFNIKDQYLDKKGRELLDIPHWLLKTHYTSKGIMFGKFWKGEEGKSRIGKEIPIPPKYFISIRSTIKSKDPFFFNKAPDLIDDLINSVDDGQQVFEELEEINLPNEDLDVLRDTKLYEKLYEKEKSTRMKRGIE